MSTAFRLLHVALILCCTLVSTWAADALPSWKEGPTKQAILAFVAKVTTPGTADFVPAAARIATFDNDGTLWCEQPMYVQFAFMLDQMKAAAPQHPEWQENAAFKALATHDRKALAKMGEKPVLERLFLANSGMTAEAYDHAIREWLKTARHPTLKRPYTELVYQPMLELLAFMRANGFKTFIVSGGSIEFMRPWSEAVYGIPPDQVIGSVSAVQFTLDATGSQLLREPKIEFIDDGPGKPVGIYRNIGQRPIAAFGNSDGDLQMLQFATTGSGARLALLVHHTDAEREFAYDRTSQVGKLDKALDEAAVKGWTVVDMKNDWLTVFPAPRLSLSLAPASCPTCEAPAKSRFALIKAAAQPGVVAETPPTGK